MKTSRWTYEKLMYRARDAFRGLAVVMADPTAIRSIAVRESLIRQYEAWADELHSHIVEEETWPVAVADDDEHTRITREFDRPRPDAVHRETT